MKFRILKWRLPLSKKFIFNDNWSLPEIYIDNNEFFVTDHIGYPNTKIDQSKYHWGKVRLPKGCTWNKDSILYETTKEYMFSQVRFYVAERDLYVQFKCGNGWGFEILPINKLSEGLQRHIRKYLSQWSYFDQLYNIVFRYKQPAIYFTIKDYQRRTYYEVYSDLRNPNSTDCYVFGRHFENGLLKILNKPYRERILMKGEMNE